ncbi:MAG: DEAD/DEAH box helicase [Panacagrimonas sp.]
MSFSDLGLIPALQDAVARSGYQNATPIQAQSIPRILAGQDILAAAQTGTGKTAAFTLPMLQLLSGTAHGAGQVRALVLVPTRELATQVGDAVAGYGRALNMRYSVMFGGVGYHPQIKTLRRGVDILVATPGRLLDHVNQGNLDLSRIEFFVLDEADRMLDMGFIHDIRRVIKHLPEQRQNLMFSATFSAEIRQLANGLLRDPAQVDVAPRNATADRIEQAIAHVGKAQKRHMLSWLISSGDWRQTLVFTRTKHGANRLCKQLNQDGISADALHGNKSQSARTRALQGFKSGSIRVLVATDIAARGLDIDQLPHVVNFELPHVPADYVHRIGRTGRAGESGIAISLVDAEERRLLKDIQRLLKRELPLLDVSGFDQYTPPKPQAIPEPCPQPSRTQKPAQNKAKPRSRPKHKRRGPPKATAKARARQSN